MRREGGQGAKRRVGGLLVLVIGSKPLWFRSSLRSYRYFAQQADLSSGRKRHSHLSCQSRSTSWRIPRQRQRSYCEGSLPGWTRRRKPLNGQTAGGGMRGAEAVGRLLFHRCNSLVVRVRLTSPTTMIMINPKRSVM